MSAAARFAAVSDAPVGRAPVGSAFATRSTTPSIGGQRLFVAVCVDDPFEELRAVDQQAESVGGDRELAGSNGAQIALELVGQPLRRPQLHHRGDALERMEVAKQIVDDAAPRGGLVGGCLELQQRRSGRGQMLFALGEIVIQEPGEELVAHDGDPALMIGADPFSSVRTVAASDCGANGLVM